MHMNCLTKWLSKEDGSYTFLIEQWQCPVASILVCWAMFGFFSAQCSKLKTQIPKLLKGPFPETIAEPHGSGQAQAQMFSPRRVSLRPKPKPKPSQAKVQAQVLYVLLALALDSNEGPQSKGHTHYNYESNHLIQLVPPLLKSNAFVTGMWIDMGQLDGDAVVELEALICPVAEPC
ncbi:hypothetical protein AAG906_027421 [Vitis piasezkii]